MAWANCEATAATVAANAATAKHFDTNVGSPRWQQMEGRQKEGGVVGAHISLAQATTKMPTHRQKKGRWREVRNGGQLGRQITNAIMKLI